MHNRKILEGIRWMLREQFLLPGYKLPVNRQGESQTLVLHSPHSRGGVGLFKGKSRIKLARVHWDIFQARVTHVDGILM